MNEVLSVGQIENLIILFIYFFLQVYLYPCRWANFITNYNFYTLSLLRHILKRLRTHSLNTIKYYIITKFQ